jgi:hypothetical protein
MIVVVAVIFETYRVFETRRVSQHRLKNIQNKNLENTQCMFSMAIWVLVTHTTTECILGTIPKTIILLVMVACLGTHHPESA